MLFSIMIPVYNVEKYLVDSVHSVLGQDEQDFEIILVDDGSTDDSGLLCDLLQDKYSEKIRVVHKENEGLLLTRRRAIRESKGEWLIHLDSDDYMFPGTLKALKKIIIEYEPDLILGKLVYGTKDIQDFSKTTQLPFDNYELFVGKKRKKLLMQFLYGGYMTSYCQKIAKREIVDIEEDYSRLSTVNIMEDHLQSLALLDKTQRPIYLDRAIIYYRLNECSMTRQKDMESLIRIFWSKQTVYDEESRYRKKWQLSDEENSKICAKHLRNMLNIIRQILNNNEAYDNKVREFIKEVANNKEIREEYRLADKRVLGNKTRMCYLLIFHEYIWLLKKC